MREVKSKKNQTKLMVGDTKMKYLGDCGTLMDDLLTVKLLLNSIISTLGSKFMILYIKNCYLNKPLVQ